MHLHFPHVLPLDDKHEWSSSPVHAICLNAPKVLQCVFSGVSLLFIPMNWMCGVYSGSGPSSANQPLMTGSSSMNQAPMTGLNQQPMVSSMSQAFPVTQSLMMGVPPMSQQPMMGQLPGQPSFNQSITTGANSLQHLPHLPYAYYQASPAAHQPPHPSLLH